MTELADIFTKGRRLFILRLLVTVGETASEAIIFRAVADSEFERASRNDIRRDLDHLLELRCTTEERLREDTLIVTLTDRGRDVAFGRETVPGVEHERWRK